LYCDSCSAIVEFSVYNKNYIHIVGDKNPWILSTEEKEIIEQSLQPCKCGGQYKFSAFPRCPHCKGNLTILLPDPIYYMELGEVLDADKNESIWKRA
jgi:hypothetical protein